MPGNKYVLDTSIIIHVIRGNNNIWERLDAMDENYVSLTSVGELYFGAYNSNDVRKHIVKLEAFLSNCSILISDTTTSEIYGQIKASLTKKGKPLPENDIWIAAAALQYNLPLFTTDKHFGEIDGIRLL